MTAAANDPTPDDTPEDWLNRADRHYMDATQQLTAGNAGATDIRIRLAQFCVERAKQART
jgi:hypothetical protein